MRKTIAIAFLALLGVGLLAAPAPAQRDPFDPAIDVEGTPPPVGGETEPEAVEPQPEAEPPSDDLANTGFEAQPFAVLAYALIATGLAALALGGIARRER